MVSPGPDIVTRLCHANALYHGSCGFGSPCNCECREIAKSPVCDVCKVSLTVYQSCKLVDWKSISSYQFTSFCEGCWEIYREEAKRKTQVREQSLAFRKDRLDNLTEYVKGLPSVEQVPIGFTVQDLSGYKMRGGRSQFAAVVPAATSRPIISRVTNCESAE